MAYLANIDHLLFVTLWELYAFTNVGHLPVSHRPSVKVTQVKAIAHICLPIRSRLSAFPQLVYIGQVDKWRVWPISVLRHVQWRGVRVIIHDHSDKAKIWQEHPDKCFDLVNQSETGRVTVTWLLASYSPQLLAHLSIVPVVGTCPTKGRGAGRT